MRKTINGIKHIEKSMFVDFVYYSETSPSGLRFLKDAPKCSRTRQKQGDVAGWKDKSGYWRLTIKNKKYLCSRIVCVLHGVDVNGKVVDHFDWNTSNNTIENLRAVEVSVNRQNSKLNAANTTGFTGVLYRITGGIQYYEARYKETKTRKQISRCFSISKYGQFGAFEMAKKCRIGMLEMLRQQGQHYTEKHGGAA